MITRTAEPSASSHWWQISRQHNANARAALDDGELDACADSIRRAEHAADAARAAELVEAQTLMDVLA